MYQIMFNLKKISFPILDVVRKLFVLTLHSLFCLHLIQFLVHVTILICICMFIKLSQKLFSRKIIIKLKQIL
ncbi:hypothetical protein CVS40_12876 [Lucilia cuprina]|nr:hypothetical protein CVS40_12876 [Lucilia cuprina]